MKTSKELVFFSAALSLVFLPVNTFGITTAFITGVVWAVSGRYFAVWWFAIRTLVRMPSLVSDFSGIQPLLKPYFTVMGSIARDPLVFSQIGWLPAFALTSAIVGFVAVTFTEAWWVKRTFHAKIGKRLRGLHR